MNKESNDGMRSADVSRTYRELATERVPETLNEAILQQATLAVSPPQKRWYRSWQHPLAAAATVALSLAVVMQIYDPAPLTAIQGEESHELADSQERRDSVVLDQPASAPADAAEVRDAETSSVRSNFLPQSPTVMDNAAEQMRLRTGPNNREPTIDAAGLDEAVAETSVARRQHSEQNAATSVQGTTSPALAHDGAQADEGLAEDTMCSSVEKSAKDWWTCIQNLRHQGQTAAADDEVERFLRQYPEFLENK